MIGLGLIVCQASMPDPLRRSPGGLKLGVAFILVLAGTGLAQNTGSLIEYDQRQWKLLKQATAAFGPGSSINVELLESLDQTGESGTGDLMYDVQLLIKKGGRVAYEHATDFYMDDELELKGVTNDGVPGVLFHNRSRRSMSLLREPIPILHL